MRTRLPLFLILTLLLISISLAGLHSGRIYQRLNEANVPASIDGLVSSRRPVDAQAPTAANSQLLAAGDVHPLEPLLDYAHEIKNHIETNVQDYTATMIKRERIWGTLGDETRMELKVRNRQLTTGVALAAYIKFLKPRGARDREVIWVENANGNRLISHEGGLLGFKRFNLEPKGELAMFGNKYPVTEIGMLRLVEKLIEKGERDRELGVCKVDVIEGQRIGDRDCRLFQVTHPVRKDGLDFHIAQIFVDTERKIPLRYAAFLWPVDGGEPPLEEEYTYIDVQLNVGLNDLDFSPENPNYNFP